MRKIIFIIIIFVFVNNIFSQPDNEKLQLFYNQKYLFLIQNDTLNLLENSNLIYNYYKNNADSTLIYDISLFVNDTTVCNRGKLLLDNIFVFRNYNAIKLSSDLNWKENPFNSRNWQWYLHKLDIIKYLIAAHYQTNNDIYLSKAFYYTFDWEKDNLEKPYPSEFSWGDHSSAMRLLNLLYLYQYSLNVNYLKKKDFIKLVRLILLHIDVLEDKNFYNRGNNHGLFQSYILLWALNIFPEYTEYEKFNKSALNRTLFEINHGITNEGVHIENSPAYHLNHLVLMSKIISIFNYYDIKYDRNYYYDLLNKGFEFMYYCIKPDGYIPLIGDSENKKLEISPYIKNFNFLPNYQLLESINKKSTKEIEKYKYYPNSGYFILKSSPYNEDKSFHLIFKAGFLSFTHKHYDDLSFILNARGEDWIIDGGLYAYQNNNKFRQYFISNRAHNIIIPDSLYCVRKWKSLKKSMLDSLSVSEDSIMVEGKHYLYDNYIISRKLIIYNDSIFKISDNVKNSTNKIVNYDLLFHIPINKHITIKKDHIVIQGNSHKMIISFNKNDFYKIEVLSGIERPEIQGWISDRYLQLNKAQCIVFRSKAKNYKGTLTFSIQDIK